MLLAKARGELVELRLVQLQAGFMLVCMRRQAMAIPQAYCDRLAAVGDPEAVKAILDEAMRGLLTEVQDLPNRIDAAEWEKFLGEQEAGGEPVAKAGKQGQPPAPQAKAKPLPNAEGGRGGVGSRRSRKSASVKRQRRQAG